MVGPFGSTKEPRGLGISERTSKGKYRQVNLAKANFMFAAANQIPRLMEEFETGPCRFDKIEKIARSLAVVHTELVLIHPFRDGNGRVARLLATLMALQGGLPPLDFSCLNDLEDFAEA